MKFYLSLQFNRINRLIVETGFHPLLGYLLMSVLFVILSELFFIKMGYAEYIYPILALGVVNLLGGSARNGFLKNCYSMRYHQMIRLLENLIISTPFVGFLLFKEQWLMACLLYLLSACFSAVNHNNRYSFVIPTPFSKWPFEFTVGFRRSFLVFILCYGLIAISIYADNFNLGVFGLVVIFMNCLGFNNSPEGPYYVWVYALSPDQFLKKKIQITIVYTLALTLPASLPLAIFFPQFALLVMLFVLIGILFMIAGVVGKYAYYPSEINLIMGLSLGLCVIFPPALLLVIPLFYVRSKRNLNSMLL